MISYGAARKAAAAALAAEEKKARGRKDDEEAAVALAVLPAESEPRRAVASRPGDSGSIGVDGCGLDGGEH